MKKLLTPLLVLLAYQVFAQDNNVESIPKGTKFIGGIISLGFNDNTTKIPDVDDSKTKSTSFGIGPVAGKYFRDNVAIGLSVGYNFSNAKFEYSDGSEYRSTFQSAGIGTSIRKSYKIVPNLFFFIQGQASVNYGESKAVDENDNETKSRSISAGLNGSPGLQIFLGKKISLESTMGLVGYSFSNSKNLETEVASTDHNINFNGGLSSVNFSVRYFIFP